MRMAPSSVDTETLTFALILVHGLGESYYLQLSNRFLAESDE